MNDAGIRKARILIVDDQVANVALLENILNRIGYGNVRGVTDSRRVLIEVEQFAPDLVLLDLNMPHIDGLHMLKQLREIIPRSSFLPVLILTEDASAPTKRKALAAGANDFLLKPFDPSEIFTRISNLLHRRFLHLEMEMKIAERTRELELALAELKARQEHAVRQGRLHAFAEMAGGVVHDFNNALMSVIGYSELFLRDPDLLDNREAALEYLKTMNTAGRDAAQVVSRLRDFYRPRAEIDVFEPLNLNDLMEESVAITQPKWRDMAQGAGRTFVVDLDLVKLPSVSGNAAEVREVFTNLIFNAVDAMPTGGTIVLKSLHIGDEVLVEICDAGVGMSDEIRDRCLEPFFSTKGEKGTGLGLSTVFGILKRHDARLEIETELGKGTTFRLRFPAQSRTFVALSPDDPTPERLLNILVVDDDPVSRDVVSKYLIADGHRVVVASGARNAVDAIGAEKFDLLITDHGMPGMNGIQLAAEVRRQGNVPHVVLLSGFQGEPALNWDTTPPNIDMVLSKPIPHRELRKAVAKLMAEGGEPKTEVLAETE
jgi:signal transduction histidine kinase